MDTQGFLRFCSVYFLLTVCGGGAGLHLFNQQVQICIGVEVEDFFSASDDPFAYHADHFVDKRFQLHAAVVYQRWDALVGGFFEELKQ